jgi:hypothetical protein
LSPFDAAGAKFMMRCIRHANIPIDISLFRSSSGRLKKKIDQII